MKFVIQTAASSLSGPAPTRRPASWLSRGREAQPCCQASHRHRERSAMTKALASVKPTFWRRAAGLVLLAAFAGCGDDDGPSAISFDPLERPPAIVLYVGDRTYELGAFGWNTPTAVADGTTTPATGPG